MANSPPAIPATAPLNRKTGINSRALEMPVASAATSASRIAISARPKRPLAMLAVIQVHAAPIARQKAYRPAVVLNGAGSSGPGTPMPPPVTLCQARAIWVTMVANPSVVMAK